MRRLAIGLTLMALCGTAWAQSFSADMVSRTQGKEMKGKIAVSENKMRLETAGNVIITRMDEGISYMLVAKEKTAMKQTVDPKMVSQISKRIKGEVSREDLGEETVNGTPARKYRVLYEVAGKRASVLQWIGKEGVPVKVASEDGKWTVEYRNLKVGPQPDMLFEVPKDYKVMDLEAMKQGALAKMGALRKTAE